MKKIVIVLVLVSLIFGDDIFDNKVSEGEIKPNFINSMGGSFGLVMGGSDQYQPVDTGIGLAFGLEYRRSIYNKFILGFSYQYVKEYDGSIRIFDGIDFTTRRHNLTLKPQFVLSEEEDNFQIFLGANIGYSIKNTDWNSDNLGEYEDKVESMIYGANLEIKHYLNSTNFVALSFDVNHFAPISDSRKRVSGGDGNLFFDPLGYDPSDGNSSVLKITVGADF